MNIIGLLNYNVTMNKSVLNSFWLLNKSAKDSFVQGQL